MNAKSILITCLAVIILFTFCYMLFCLAKSVGTFSAQFDKLSEEQMASETSSDEEDVEMESESTSSSRGSYGSASGTQNVRYTSAGGNTRSISSTGDNENMDALIDEIIKMAADAGMDPLDYLDALLAETNTGSKSASTRTSTAMTKKTAVSTTMASGSQTAAGQSTTPGSITITVADEVTGAESPSSMTPDELQRLMSELTPTGVNQVPPEQDTTPGDAESESSAESTEEVEPASGEETNDEG